MATVEEPNQTSSKPFIDIWYSFSMIHFGRGWPYWTGFLIKLDYFDSVTLYRNKYSQLLFLWWLLWFCSRANSKNQRTCPLICSHHNALTLQVRGLFLLYWSSTNQFLNRIFVRFYLEAIYIYTYKQTQVKVVSLLFCF